MATPEASHGTKQEIAFLENIGTFCETRSQSRRELLAAYIKAAALRSRWGHIHKNAVLDHAQKLLKGK